MTFQEPVIAEPLRPMHAHPAVDAIDDVRGSPTSDRHLPR